jgi:hypothetical protein
VVVIAAGLALAVASLIGAYDLLSDLEHIRRAAFFTATGV